MTGVLTVDADRAGRDPHIADPRNARDAATCQLSATSTGRTWLGGVGTRTALLIVAIVLGVLALYPVSMLVVGSFRSAPPGGDGTWTLEAWIHAYADPLLAQTVWTSLGLAAVSMVASSAIGAGMAWLVTRTDAPGGRFLERLMMFGFFIPAIISAIAWSILGNPRAGVINQVIGALLGHEVQVVNVYSRLGLAFQYTTVFAPLVFLLVLGPFKAIDGSLEEASRMAGATVIGTARRITLPLLAGAITGAGILVFVRVLESFEIPQILATPAGIDVFMTRIYAATSQSIVPNYPAATALGVLVLVVTLAMVAMQIRYVSKRSFVTVTGKPIGSDVLPLGKLRIPLGILAWAYVVIAILLPTVQIVVASFQRISGYYSASNWTLEAWQNTLISEQFLPTLWNTIGFAVGGGIIAMALTTGAAYAIVRIRSRWTRALEIITWLPWALPGLVLGLGILWGYSSLPGGGTLYGTPTIMLLAYVTIALPLGARAMTAAIGQLNPELEESARVHGATWMKAFGRVVVPLVRPSFFFGFTVAFVLISREVGASLLLYSPETKVLSVDIIQAWTDGRAPDAVVMSCILMLMAGLVIALDRVLARAFPSAN